jgi:hypothetical protein
MYPHIMHLIAAQKVQDDIRAATQAREAKTATDRKDEVTPRGRRFVRRPRPSTIPGQ